MNYVAQPGPQPRAGGTSIKFMDAHLRLGTQRVLAMSRVAVNTKATSFMAVQRSPKT